MIDDEYSDATAEKWEALAKGLRDRERDWLKVGKVQTLPWQNLSWYEQQVMLPLEAQSAMSAQAMVNHLRYGPQQRYNSGLFSGLLGSVGL